MALSPFSRFGVSALVGTRQQERRHIVVAGETIQAIAANEFQGGYDSELWRQIAEANSIDDLDALTVNTVLVIPAPLPSTT